MDSVTFNALGKYGWLGNQLFQMSTCIATAMDNGCEAYFPEWPWSKRMPVLGMMCRSDVRKNTVTYSEKKFSFDKIPNISGDVNLHGYFQSAKYFDNYKESICNSIEQGMIGHNGMSINKLREMLHDVCFVHVRRGDYLNLSHVYVILNDSYYMVAINKMKDYGFSKFAVVTNDVNYCKSVFKGNEYLFFSGDQADDLSIMAACGGAIIANSSFSWWGSYLGNKVKVIAPDRWFNQSGPADYHDLYLKNWDLMPI